MRIEEDFSGNLIEDIMKGEEEDFDFGDDDEGKYSRQNSFPKSQRNLNDRPVLASSHRADTPHACCIDTLRPLLHPSLEALAELPQCSI